jgi:nucleoside-diphosphate-sugar epimerase
VKQVFVTGASGFVGAHLVYALLQKNYAVTALVRSPENLDAFHALSPLYPGVSTHSVNWVTGDLLFPEGWLNAVADADAVFHAAALVSFSTKDRHLLMETNVKGTAHIVNACLQCNQKPLIYVSSVAALGRSEEEVTEHTPWVDSGRNTDYAVSKYLAEQEVWRGVEEGLPAAIVCPGIVIGPWGKNTGSGQIPALVKKRMPFFPVGENGFTGVRDVVKMLLLLYEEERYGHRFLCIARNTSYRFVLTNLANCFSVPAPKYPLSGLTLNGLIMLARLAEFISIPFPFPSQGLKSTSLKTRYVSVYEHLIPNMQYLPMEETLEETAKAYNNFYESSV